MTENLFYEYAIIPDAFDSRFIASNPTLGVILVQMLKGIRENGMIADLDNGGWRNLVSEKIKEIENPKTKDSLMHCLSLLADRKRLNFYPPSSKKPVNDEDWLALAREAHKRISFNGIIACKKTLESCHSENSCQIDVLDVLDSSQWNKRRRTLTLETNTIYYTPVLEPILRHARKLTIVDPHFTPHESRFLEFLNICIKQMGRAWPSIRRKIIIHCGNKNFKTETNPERIRNWELKIKELTSEHERKNISIQVFLRGRRKDGRRFHDRYIFTDQCCVEIPLGTDTNEGISQDNTTWALLENDDMDKKAMEIRPDSKVFECFGNLEIII